MIGAKIKPCNNLNMETKRTQCNNALKKQPEGWSAVKVPITSHTDQGKSILQILKNSLQSYKLLAG